MELSSQQKSLIIGSMLGDGFLRRRKSSHNTSLEIKRSYKDLIYAEEQFKILNPLCTDNGFKTFNRFDKRTNKNYDNVVISTKSLNCLNYYHNSWYNTNKVVPNNIILDKLSIAIWFFDDGNIRILNNKPYLTLYTNAFTLDEVQYLKTLLNNRYNTKYFVYEILNKNQYIIRGNSDSIELFKDIDEYSYFLPRKSNLWKNYLNSNFKNKTNKQNMFLMLNYIKNIKEFSAKEIAIKFDLLDNKNINSTFYSFLRKCVFNKNLIKNQNIYIVNNLDNCLDKYIKHFKINE